MNFSWTECGITICVLVVLAAIYATIPARRMRNRKIAGVLPEASDSCKRNYVP